MIMWIILGYLGVSVVASLVFYAACVAAARADRVQQSLLTDLPTRERDVEGQRLDRTPAPRLALHV